MRDFYKRVAQALEPSGVPAFLNYWRKSAQYPDTPMPHCVYYRANRQDALSADDEPVLAQTEFCVTVFGKGNIMQAVERVRAALESAGFEVVEIEDEDAVKPGEYATHLYCVAYEQVH